MPPRWNGQPAPRIMHRSMSCGLGDDALVEHQPRSPRPARRSARSRTCSVGRAARSPCAQQRRDLGVDVPAGRARPRRRRPRLPAATSRRRFSRDARSGPGTPRAASRRRAARSPGRPAASSTNGDIGRPSGASARSATSSGVPSSTRPVTSPRKRVSSRLTTNAGASLTSTQVFFSVLADGERGGQRRVVGALAADDLQQRQHRDRVEEVEADDPLGVLAGSAAISVTDSEEVLVASTHSGRDDRLDLGEHLLLDRHLLEDGLDHEVGVGERVLGQRAGDQRLEPVRRVGADPALGAAACRSRRARSRRPCRRRAWSRSVSTTGTSSRRTNSSASWLAIRPAPTTPTLVTGRASDVSGAPAGPLGPLLDQVEGVERRRAARRS